MIAAWAVMQLPEKQSESKRSTPHDNRIVVRTGKGRFRTDILANGHALVAGDPESVGGTNSGPAPYEYLAASLGSCTPITLRMYADRKKWPLDEVVVRLKHSKVHLEDCKSCDESDAWIDKIEREIELKGNPVRGQKERLVEIANRCPVHRTLESDALDE